MSHTALKMSNMLYDYQVSCLDKAKPNFIYALDTGTGKTMLAIHHYLKYGNGEPLLIVAPPQKIKEGGWDRELERVANHYGISIEYDTLSYGVLAKKWIEYQKWFVIFDECHYVKNPTSQRGKAALKLTKQSSHFVLLSATPSSNGWEDTINYMLMFGFYRNKTQFLREHAVYEKKYFGPNAVNVISGWKKEEKLKNLYGDISVKLSKDDCLDLPPLVVEDIFFKVSKEYKIIERDRVLGETLYDTNMSLQHGLRFYANQTDKLKYTEMLANGTSENVVIFYYYQQEKDSLLEMLKDKTVFEVSGKTTKIPHKEEWENLKNTVTLVQYQAGAAGIELQYANVVIFYTPTWSYQDYEQALGRCYRNGQTKKVTVYRYITRNSLEERVYAALAEKKDFSEKLFQEYVGGN
ncbi:helicase-related protein [Bacillus smithii]|uniref:helicase-related protein n=1 Tax=Bacillus smithii TaxID=1479 RepID=UPI003D1E42F4